MEYMIKNFSMGALGEPTKNSPQLLEAGQLKSGCIHTFNNSDYVGTITIKGSHKQRLYASDFRTQFLLFIKIKDLIQDYCEYYCINYEVHKCNEWIHSHFIFRPRRRYKMPKMRQEIYQLIEGCKLKTKSYRHRILIEKPYNYCNYIDYMFKEYDIMKFYNLHSHYKLKSNPIIYNASKVLQEKTYESQTSPREEIPTQCRNNCPSSQC